MDGEVVGINSAKLASTEVEGMGYAIAISDVTDTLEDLMNETPRDKVDNHGVLGITGMTVSDEASQYYGIPEGVLVSEVTEGGAAEDAGIKEKSIITEFDGKRVRSIDELVSLSLIHISSFEKIPLRMIFTARRQYSKGVGNHLIHFLTGFTAFVDLMKNFSVFNKKYSGRMTCCLCTCLLYTSGSVG